MGGWGGSPGSTRRLVSLFPTPTPLEVPEERLVVVGTEWPAGASGGAGTSWATAEGTGGAAVDRPEHGVQHRCEKQQEHHEPEHAPKTILGQVKHFVVYTVLRLALFVATYAVLSLPAVLLFGNEVTVLFVTLVVSAVVSSLLSLRLLAGPRERFAQAVQGRAERASAKLEEMRSREDVD